MLAGRCCCCGDGRGGARVGRAGALRAPDPPRRGMLNGKRRLDFDEAVEFVLANSFSSVWR